MITGTRSPIRIFAFSLLRTRMRGFARILLSESSFLALMVTPPIAALMLSLLMPLRLPKVKGTVLVVVAIPVLVVVVACASDSPTVSGQRIPSSVRRERLISMISTSSITSGSFKSCSVMMRSAMRIASGVSRMMISPSRSSITMSFVFRMVLMVLDTAFTSAFARKNVRTESGWYSFSFCGVLG